MVLDPGANLKMAIMSVPEKRVAVFRKEHFNAAHRIFNPAWDDKKNAEVFGKCSNPLYHGHNYELIVKVTGVPDPETGYVMDMKVLSRITAEEVLGKFDHRNLNLDTNAFHEIVPTTENLAFEIARRLKRAWTSYFPGDWPRLEKIRIEETPRNIFEIRADEIE